MARWMIGTQRFPTAMANGDQRAASGRAEADFYMGRFMRGEGSNRHEKANRLGGSQLSMRPHSTTAGPCGPS